ncbi:efflux RND transporter periplasmic adaptor subunit [Paraburkholderia sp. SIMBA_055]|jgi:RND family efflux transporter MFP subunit|uniref:efflux RND transporter periplasmic adaptor subunit n=1 Tax=Paraburkholderia TaxID=1822464 RepID=UPI000D2F69B3|nr:MULTISPECIES: efflux RND transporter periplasmic adaptor subunit [Paraburkholderia]AXF08149.1 efflux RND transporter periplasmic adaptor subunit [Paraburkholderia graminis]MDR6466950.1 RND family efflux transporter MFP subunit [Paraburkholderia graminis]MDR6473774.1 RND family efflux transporter MFP subunit [Paraburkholderia graminis]PTR04424.1 RND family efflux transporter MFP subunit [Paraburkholderia sp. GV072]PUB09381.1 RND family efflux transporter MFP subunit [Paraburkholderia sp. GV0
MRQQSPRLAGQRRARRLAVALALAGVVALSACSKKEAAAPEPRPVVAVAVHADGNAAPVASLPGEVQARYSTPLSFRVGGKIVERRVRLGDVVKSGQIVARLDPADAQKNAASAQAQLAAAEHSYQYAKQQLDRDRAQAKENLIAPAQLEQTTNAYASAAAQRDQAAQQAALSKDQLQYTTLAADHAGVITAEQADTGQNVSAGQAVYNLAWSGELDVVCDVPESALAGLSVGQTANVTLGALPGRKFTARVRELSPAADPQSRTYRAKLTLENPGPDVRLGMTADIALSARSSSAASNAEGEHGFFVLPSTALFHDGTQPAVWVVRAADSALELRRVTVARYNERTIVVSQGLKNGEHVVLQGVHTVSAGEKVRAIAPLHPEDFAS